MIGLKYPSRSCLSAECVILKRYLECSLRTSVQLASSFARNACQALSQLYPTYTARVWRIQSVVRGPWAWPLRECMPCRACQRALWSQGCNATAGRRYIYWRLERVGFYTGMPAAAGPTRSQRQQVRQCQCRAVAPGAFTTE